LVESRLKPWVNQAFVELDLMSAMEPVQQQLVTQFTRFVFEGSLES